MSGRRWTGSELDGLQSKLEADTTARSQWAAEAIHDLRQHLSRLTRELEEARERGRAYREALREIGEFAACHHDHQEDHYWLHALQVDIPHMVEHALATPPEASEP